MNKKDYDKINDNDRSKIKILGKKTILKFNDIFEDKSKNIQFYLGIDLLEFLVISFFINTNNPPETIEVFCNLITSSMKKVIDALDKK